MAGSDLYEALPNYFSDQRKDLFWYEQLWSVLLHQLEKRHKQRTLIEFGSGPGFLCALAERRGWYGLIHGIEPSAIARKHANSLKLRIAEFRETYNGHSLFRHAIATEVLEHVENPRATLEHWHSALLPGGYLALSVPNDGWNGEGNPLQRLFWGCEKPWIHPTHLNYWCPASLKALVDSVGFQTVWQRTSFPVELLLVLPIPRKWAWKLSRVWPAPPLLWRLGLGRHCLLVARKLL